MTVGFAALVGGVWMNRTRPRVVGMSGGVLYGLGVFLASQASEITGVPAIVAARMLGIISIANGAGRFLWAWLSDFIGRKWVFVCYGGGIGTMRAFATDYFGPRNISRC